MMMMEDKKESYINTTTTRKKNKQSSRHLNKLIVLLSGLSRIDARDEHRQVVARLWNHSDLDLVLLRQRLELNVRVDPTVDNLHLRISQFLSD